MLWAVKIFFLAGALLVLQSAWAFVDGIRFLSLVRRRRNSLRGRYTPSAAVVIPCKGVDAGFDANLDRFLNQDYPDYQVVLVVATTADLAYQNLRARLEAAVTSGVIRKPRTSLVVAGVSDGRGEKVNNLVRGIEAVDAAAHVLVFADIDAAPSPDWLRSLVAALTNSQITVSTGFRWYLPGEGFVSRLRAAWDTSIATMMGDHDHNFAWGGSMAIRAADFHGLRIAERYWVNTVSDDYALTRAVREAGGKIAFEPRCLLASREESSLREFLRWSTRQIIITRVYAAHLWKLGLATYLFYCGTLTLGLIAMAMPGATALQRVAVAFTLLAVLLLGAAKGYIRSLVARDLFAAEIGSRASCYWQLSPLVPWIMLGNFVVAGFTRRIDWRGTEYELVSRDKVRVMRRTGG
jgi:cellulose synthase/poly-beta-1,6-N-acetylglucosamine synthase-like glycosyltransferase